MSGLLVLVFGAIKIYIIIAAILLLIEVIANIVIFTKAEQAGWKAVIPIYNTFTMYKIIQLPPMLIIIEICRIILSVCNYFEISTFLIIILNVIISFASLILYIVANLKLAKCFGKSTLFGIGLILFNTIFIYILAFGNSKYILKDKKIYEKVFGNNNNEEYTPRSEFFK